MRRPTLAIMIAIGMLASCTLSGPENTPRYVTATLPAAPTLGIQTAALPPAPTVTLSTTLPPALPTVMPSPLPSLTAPPSPTPTMPGPPTVLPLDDGSGNPIAGTGNDAAPLAESGFEPGDVAQVQTTGGGTLNVRREPGGQVLAQLANGSLVTVVGGPRLFDGLRWWQITTGSGVAGWAVESVPAANGQRLRTLLPFGQ